MGGNAKGTNQITKEVTSAQKIPLKEIGRSQFIQTFINLFEEIDRRFNAEYSRPLWSNKRILKNGTAFNGSTSFIMDEGISNEEVIQYRPTIGDLDIMVKKSDKSDLWKLLQNFEAEPEIMKDVVYKGSNKPREQGIGNQINCVFEATFGDTVIQCQVDWEFTAFEGEGENEVPKEFSRFGHSSIFSDAQKGIKGVFHKYILRALAGATSFKKDVLILTPQGSFTNRRFQKKGGKLITIIRMKKFDINKGLRDAYEQVLHPETQKPWINEGKTVYKDIATEDSQYETSINGMFKSLFHSDSDSDEFDKMWSFIGVIELMTKHLDEDSITNTFQRFVELQWGDGAQKLERDKKSIDREVKEKSVNYMISQIPQLKKYNKDIEEKANVFYNNYIKAKLSEA